MQVQVYEFRVKQDADLDFTCKHQQKHKFATFILQPATRPFDRFFLAIAPFGLVGRASAPKCMMLENEQE